VAPGTPGSYAAARDRLEPGDDVIRRILHLSDVHAGSSGRDAFDVEALEHLDAVLAAVADVEHLDLVVVSGDVADDGSVAGLEAVRDRVSGFAADRGIPQIYCMGNHDDRDSFRAVLGTGHLDAAGVEVGRAWTGDPEVAAVSTHDGLRVVTHDSMIPGEVHGELRAEQLAWLSETVADPASAGSLVVLHHPPLVPDGSVFFRHAALRSPDGLGRALAGTDVRAVLCGHFHAPGFGALGVVPVSIAPAVVWRIDSTAPPAVVRAVGGSGAGIVDLTGTSPGFQLVGFVGTDAGRVLFEVDALTGEPVGVTESVSS
jgi:3',5'-cyclic AMP phosphodiesterase CpdA